MLQIIIAIICGIMVFIPFAFFMIAAYKPKRIYKVHYICYGMYNRERIIFLKARDIADIQKQLLDKESPWDVEILSMEAVK